MKHDMGDERELGAETPGASRDTERLVAALDQAGRARRKELEDARAQDLSAEDAKRVQQAFERAKADRRPREHTPRFGTGPWLALLAAAAALYVVYVGIGGRADEEPSPGPVDPLADLELGANENGLSVERDAAGTLTFRWGTEFGVSEFAIVEVFALDEGGARGERVARSDELEGQSWTPPPAVQAELRLHDRLEWVLVIFGSEGMPKASETGAPFRAADSD